MMNVMHCLHFQTESDPDKLYRFRVENYQPPQEKSRVHEPVASLTLLFGSYAYKCFMLPLSHPQWQLLRELESSSSGGFSSAKDNKSMTEARRRELYHQQKFQLSDRRPGMLDKDSRFFNALPENDQVELLSKLKGSS
jgi:hypothetical protein